jgi:aspartate-semialdehyde dehydrogenase
MLLPAGLPAPCLPACPPAAKVKRMVVSTYQAASGAGQAAMEELELQTREVLDGERRVVLI